VLLRLGEWLFGFGSGGGYFLALLFIAFLLSNEASDVILA
jgi:hypothetical protein